MTVEVTNQEKLDCAEREVRMRERVYVRWVNDGKMSAGKAAWEIACMKAIAEDYRALADKDRLL